MGSLVPALKDRAVLAGWIAGLALAAVLAWSLTFTVRMNALMNASNRALAAVEDARRLYAPLPRAYQSRGPLGGWYSLAGSDSLFFVFAVMRDGILVPHGAEVGPDGRVAEVVPLGAHARQLAGGIPGGVLEAYVRRIESSPAARRGALEGEAYE